MNEAKRNPLPYLLLLAFLAGALGLYLYSAGKTIPRAEQPPAVPAAAGTVIETQGGGGYRDFAKGPLSAFLVKAERPIVPDIAFKGAQGEDAKLSQWKGRVVLLNLWATWCAPCRKEMPTLADLQKQMGSKDFEVLALSVDRKGLAASSAYLKETGADALGLYVDVTTKSLDDLQGLGLPLTILVDRKGREIGRLLGPAEWNSAEALGLMKAAIAEAP
jgi:thiol-disulfide isomerase/thioredoxin